MLTALLVAALQGATLGQASEAAPPDTTWPPPDSAAMATAYRDPGTRELVRLARTQWDRIDASVFHYTTTAHQRVSVGMRALRRDRLVYRREVVSRVDWWRDRPGRVTVLGAREAVPVAMPGIQLPDDLDRWARDFVPEPGDDRLWITPGDGQFAWHPLVAGGEALYTYASGDTTVIRLPDGRQVRLVELRVTPRTRDIRLITGSFWIEMEGYGIVQAVFKPARDFDLERDAGLLGEDEEGGDVPAVLRPIGFDIDYITVEYGLWEMRWWMPRLMAFRGQVRLGPVRLPITLEVAYDDYTVEADRYGLPELPPVIRRLAGDPHTRPRPYRHRIAVDVPEDSAALLASAELSASFYEEGEALLTETELRELADRVGALPPPPWELGRPRVTAPWVPGRGLLRYNRVEGLSAGARLDWDLARARVDITARLGSADLEPRAEVGVEVPRLDRTWRVAGYHRLAAMDPSQRPLGAGNSLAALLAGRDDGMYFRATGAEVRLDPGPDGRHGVRLYAERQRPARVHTDFSLAHLGGGAFRPNLDAAPLTQLGIAGRIGVQRGLDPVGVRWAAWVDLVAETGEATFLRSGVGGRLAGPLPAGLLGVVEVAAGTSTGDEMPVQSLWHLGGSATLRGFPGSGWVGPELGRARVELANDVPGARLVLFSDAGWAGRLEDYRADDVGVSVGVGASVLDGLLRVDLARAVHPTDGWRLELYVDALF